jgi:hypothetical protein
MDGNEGQPFTVVAYAPGAAAEGLARLTADALDYAKEVGGSFPA